MSKKLVLNLSDDAFQHLEVLAFGLNRQHYPDQPKNEQLIDGHNKQNDDFGPLVSRLLEGVANSLADGVRRPGSWERGVLDSLTGWDGTINRGMFGDMVKLDETPSVLDTLAAAKRKANDS